LGGNNHELLASGLVGSLQLRKIFRRAIRSEYWFWVLFTIIGGLATGSLDYALFSNVTGASPLNGVFELITFLPSLGMSIRRLHDIGRSGWWVLIALTVIGIFVLLYWACKKGTPGPTSFGPDPFGADGQISPRPAT
jgi:uncharacterized membrane protein YhaH (DUF805 family)